MVKYHLSYDTKDCDTDFASYDEAREFILCVIGNTNYTLIESFAASTLIIEYPVIQPNIFKYIKKNLSPYFYYSLSRVAVRDNGLAIEHNKNLFLNFNLKEELDKLVCLFDGKTITDYPYTGD